MRWLDRRKARLQVVADENSMQASAADTLPPDVREAIDKALAPYPLKDVREARFFGVPMLMFTKDELIRIVSWVGMNARDHKRDS